MEHRTFSHGGISARPSVVRQLLGRLSSPWVSMVYLELFSRENFCVSPIRGSVPLGGGPEQEGIFRSGPVK